MNNIMIVEDEALIAMSLQNKLENMGYSVPSVAHTGEEAVREAGKHNPDLILMDINLAGDISGITAAEQINSQKEIPIVFLTAYSDETTLQLAKGAKPFGYLIKPFKDRELRSTIEVALHRHQKELEEIEKTRVQAEETGRMKSSMMAVISHEVCTTSNSTLGFTELLRQPGYSSESQKEFAEKITATSSHMVNLVDDVLGLSKTDSSNLLVTVKPCHVNNLVLDVYNDFKDGAFAKGLQLTFQLGLPPDQCSVNTDSEMVYSILSHLVKDAIRFTNEGTIDFGYRMVESTGQQMLEFFVKDIGNGIQAEKANEIFNHVRRMNQLRNEAADNSGFDLAKGKIFAELLGGTIRLENQPVKGTVFYFTIPFKQA